MRFCRDAGVNVVPRGAGTSLSGGAIPQEDAIVLGLSKMSRILEINLADRYARVEAGSPISRFPRRSRPDGFFYAPDPSSQLACTIGGNIGMNSGRRALPQIRRDDQQSARRPFRHRWTAKSSTSAGPASTPPGYDLLGLVCGSEGQLGIVTEATVRLLRAAEGARPVLFGFDSAEAAGQCVAAIIGAGIVPVAMEYMDKLAIEICEDFAHAGYPLDVEAMLIIEVEGSEEEMAAELAKIARDRQGAWRAQRCANRCRRWRARRSGRAANRPSARPAGSPTTSAWTAPCRPADCREALEAHRRNLRLRYGLRVANVFHAGDGNMHPLILYNVNDEAEQRQGRGRRAPTS